jgi:hypothetical protein
LEPYWGKPAVRNLREDDGNVGIIRSPVRAIVPPDNCSFFKQNQQFATDRLDDKLYLRTFIA